MRFKTSLKTSEDKAFPIEIDLAQMPCIYHSGITKQEIDILGSYYDVLQILYRHGGKVELILHCKAPNPNGAYKDLLLLEYSGAENSLIQLSVKSSSLPHNMEILLNLFRIPETKFEFVEKDGIVYDLDYYHLKDDNICEGVSFVIAKLEDFYKQYNYPYKSIPD